MALPMNSAVAGVKAPPVMNTRLGKMSGHRSLMVAYTSGPLTTGINTSHNTRSNRSPA